MKKFLAFSLLSLLLSAAIARGKEEIFEDKEGMNCYVYTPETIDPEREYQLVVGVHGSGGDGRGALGLSGWAARGDVIVVGPSFSSDKGDPYQFAKGSPARKLLDIQKKLQKKYKLREKMFLHGFSAGSQFVHRFAMYYPEVVCGVSAHSGGTWATDGYGRINSNARTIPFAISCGEEDNVKAGSGSPFTRLEWLLRFSKKIDGRKFVHLTKTWPGVGHSQSGEVNTMIMECFQLATGLPGKSATEKIAISPDWKNLETLQTPDEAAQKNTSPSYDTSPPSTGNTAKVADEETEKMLKAAFRKADEEEIPDASLIIFMKKYPPTLWGEREESAKLAAQCQRAAKAWQAEAKKKGTWSEKTEQEFEEFTQGLELAP